MTLKLVRSTECEWLNSKISISSRTSILLLISTWRTIWYHFFVTSMLPGIASDFLNWQINCKDEWKLYPSELFHYLYIVYFRVARVLLSSRVTINSWQKASRKYPHLEMPVPSQGQYGFHSFPVVDWFCLSIFLWVLTFPL